MFKHLKKTKKKSVTEKFLLLFKFFWEGKKKVEKFNSNFTKDREELTVK